MDLTTTAYSRAVRYEAGMSAQIIEFPRTFKRLSVEENTSDRKQGRPEIERSPNVRKILNEVFNGPPPSPEQLRREYFLLECD
jgi:hypothetical protein